MLQFNHQVKYSTHKNQFQALLLVRIENTRPHRSSHTLRIDTLSTILASSNYKQFKIIMFLMFKIQDWVSIQQIIFIQSDMQAQPKRPTKELVMSLKDLELLVAPRKLRTCKSIQWNSLPTPMFT